MAAEQKKFKILVVDDSRVMRAAVKKILGASYDIFEAENGEVGWECLLENSDIQLVFCDLNMPVMNGYELLKRVRNSEDSKLQNIPIVIITGNDDDTETKEQVLENGASDFISKPFDSIQLQARAKSYVNLKQTSERLQKEATIDELTGLGSLRYYDKVVNGEIANINRHGGECVILQIALANFNQLFIKYGRESATSILGDVGKIISELVRAEDKAARVSLATFSIFLLSADIDGAIKLAARIQEKIHSTKFSFDDTSVNITTNAAIFEPNIDDDSSFKTIFEKANEHLKSAIESDNNEILIKTEIQKPEEADVDIEQSSLTLLDAIKFLENNEFDEIKKVKNSLLIQLIPLLKLIITDNTMLKKMVAMLKK